MRNVNIFPHTNSFFLGKQVNEMKKIAIVYDFDKTIYKGLIDQVGQEIGPADCKGFRLG